MEYRAEKAEMDPKKCRKPVFYGPETQLAIENFPISGIRFHRQFIRALGLIKAAAARVNGELNLLDHARSEAIQKASLAVAHNEHDLHFPVDIFQTGSGTSIHMNANEVIAKLSSTESLKVDAHEHVNCGQSSNDVIPTAIHVSSILEIQENLLPGMCHLQEVLLQRASENDPIRKMGRTHLREAIPISLGDEIRAWAAQVSQGIERIEASQVRLADLAIGGTAVGSGIQSHPEFGSRVVLELRQLTGFPFRETRNHFSAQSSMDSATELSGQLKTYASSLFKIANDLRWMNSGPLAGLSEITLPTLQPGSSIMRGKINPVIPEATLMVCAQVIGNDVTVAMGNSAGNFELNTMLPVIARNLLESIQLLGNVSRILADKSVAGFKVNTAVLDEQVEKSVKYFPDSRSKHDPRLERTAP